MLCASRYAVRFIFWHVDIRNQQPSRTNGRGGIRKFRAQKGSVALTDLVPTSPLDSNTASSPFVETQRRSTVLDASWKKSSLPLSQPLLSSPFLVPSNCSFLLLRDSCAPLQERFKLVADEYTCCIGAFATSLLLVRKTCGAVDTWMLDHRPTPTISDWPCKHPTATQ